MQLDAQQPPDDDSLYDPKLFISPSAVRLAIDKCQIELEKHQMSTFNHKARQLTPISIRQLTRPNWSKEFEKAGVENHD